MPSVRFALAQINPTVGALEANYELALRAALQAAEDGANLVAFPEMALTGYPVEDLALRPAFQAATWQMTERLARELKERGHGHLTVILGVLRAKAGRPQNCAAIIRSGAIERVYVKHHLPNYGVFDERRLFVAGDAPVVIGIHGLTVSIAICEDIWIDDSPAQQAAQGGDADLLLVINASPYERGKHSQRLALCRQRAAECGASVAYVNCVGGQDELVFDGGSMVVRHDGSVATSAPRFESAILYFDLSPRSQDSYRAKITDGTLAAQPTDLQEVYQALRMGLADYVNKNRIPSVLLGMSGGIDSAFVAALACDALGPERVFGVAMPSQYSSQHSVEDARESAQRTGMSLREIPITGPFDAYQKELNLLGLAEENLQARIRGTMLMAISNAEGHLVLATGNKSELAVGYSTIYGDAVGGFAPIKDVPKTLVWQLAQWRNDQAEVLARTPPIPPRSITKPPSAELRPGQLDTDSLPDYAQLDAIVQHYVEGRFTAADMLAEGIDPAEAERVIQLIDRAEYKRRQYPPGTKVTRLAFGRDRRMPITNRWSEPGEGVE